MLIKILAIIFSILSFVAPAEEEHQERGLGLKKSRQFSQRPPGEDYCLGGRGLAAFANGEDYNMPGMVALLTDSRCQERYPQIAREALSLRISFFDEPFRFRQLASNYNPSSLQSVEQTSQALQRVLPVVMKNHPMTNDSILPVLGQTAVLSQVAARKVLAEMVQNELIASDPLMKSSSRNKEKLASDLAETLLGLGANSDFIAREIAKATEELALSSQVDSLGKVLSALAEAARAEDQLVRTLEQTVGGAQSGVSKGAEFFKFEQRQKLLKVFFENIKPEFLSDPEFEKVSLQFNQAMKTLLNQQELGRTVLRDAWRDCLKILSKNTHQQSLALALALSLTGELVYLGENDKQNLLLAANQYPILAYTIQRVFLGEWQLVWEQLHERMIPPSLFNSRKDKYFIPFTESILELDPQVIDTHWVRLVWEKGFIKDPQIETRFPKMVLAQLKNREENSQKLLNSASFEQIGEGLAADISVSRALSSVQLPALKMWLKKYQASEE